jgi:malate synthase
VQPRFDLPHGLTSRDVLKVPQVPELPERFVNVGATLEIAQLGESEPPGAARVLTPEALEFVANLHQQFETRRRALLQMRDERQVSLRAGALPDFLPETAHIRKQSWQVAPAPEDLNDRRVEITGPVDRKMTINALNSGAQVFMADFEDSLSPTWTNVIEGQANLQDAVRRELDYQSPEFDFGLYFFHNVRALLERGTGPYFYLPKLENHLEAHLWNDVFNAAQDGLAIPRGTIRATVLIETILAAFEMDEILYELRTHAAGLNAGRWDYIFSTIKKFAHRSDFVLPDRAQVTMAVPFMSAYTDLLVRTCHRRGAHAIGGMAAFIPNRRDADVTERALAKVREDKERESGKGFDGTWVAHPDLVPVAREEFDRALGSAPHQKQVSREEVRVGARELLDVHIEGGSITRAGVNTNIEVALTYIDAWLRGTGAVAIHNLMEDLATAEISRAQLWQWRVHGSVLDDGTVFSDKVYRQMRAERLNALQSENSDGESRLADAAALLDALVLSADFVPFLSLSGYNQLD